MQKRPSKVKVLRLDEPKQETTTETNDKQTQSNEPVQLGGRVHSSRSKGGLVSLPSSHKDTLGGLKVLFSLNLGCFDITEWDSLTTQEKFWYIPLFLCQEFFTTLCLDSASHPKDDWSNRSLSFWLMLAKMIPEDNLEYLGKVPDDLEATRAFFDKFVSNPPSPGDFFDSLSFCDPIFGIPYKVTSLKVQKIFKAKTKPTLCEVTYENNHSPMRLIFKTGDDLRRDMYVESMFFVFNQLWEKSSLSVKPFIYLYKVFPSENNTGYVEFVENSATVQSFDWSKLDSWNEDKRNKFIRSAAGAYVGSFILGVRDRHRDNMMITDDGFFLHIDFGTWFDANRFAIPSEMKKKLTAVQWDSFLQLCGEGFGVLRRHQGLITALIVETFKTMYTEDMIMDCLDGAFYGRKSEKNAIAHIKDLASMGEASGKKKMKDMAHAIESNDKIGKFIPKT